MRTDGKVSMITRRINPASRLVDVYVSLPHDSGLVLETFLRARVVVDTKTALIVPRQAVLPVENKRVLYTVQDGKAVEHDVTIGLEDANNVEIIGGGVNAGDTVVVLGNAELENGMAVQVEEEAASQPSGEAEEKGGQKGGEKADEGEKAQAGEKAGEKPAAAENGQEQGGAGEKAASQEANQPSAGAEEKSPQSTPEDSAQAAAPGGGAEIEPQTQEPQQKPSERENQ